MRSFQHFQHEFSCHIRDPRRTRLPAGVSPRRMAIYGELLFNNLTGFLDACFPVTHQILGTRRWRQLQRDFYREARCQTPYFREIPREFLGWLPEKAGPAWLKALAHYEWVELHLDVMDCDVPPHDPGGDLIANIPLLTPALMNLTYDWPVQCIGPDYRPRKPCPTNLLVYRDCEDEVRFIELNPISARLVDLLSEGHTGRAVCQVIASELGHTDPQTVICHGTALLGRLRDAGAILGTRP
ncbi:MAG: hypothetical protein RIR70_1435 [Pseudomonadota bacterium]|jgi:hypothetical protein